MKLFTWLFSVGLLLSPLGNSALAELKVFACEPEWAALVQELGGDRVEVFSATTAEQDPHHIQARPSLIARARQADLLVCNGAGLEDGWLPVLLRRAGNGQIQPGQPGHFLASAQVELLAVPKALDRAHGDIHAEGNPHLLGDPNNILRVANALAPLLSRLDPDHHDAYQSRHAGFSRRWQQAVLDWEARARPLRGKQVVVQHDTWVYLLGWLEMKQLATLEPVAGVSPGTAHLAGLLQRLQTQGVAMVIRAHYQDPRPSQWLGSRLPAAVAVLPATVGAEGVTDLFALYELTLQRLLEAVP